MEIKAGFWSLHAMPEGAYSKIIEFKKQDTVMLNKIANQIARLHVAYFSENYQTKDLEINRIILNETDANTLLKEFESLLIKKFSKRIKSANESEGSFVYINLKIRDFSEELFGKAVYNLNYHHKYTSIFTSLLFDENRKIDLFFKNQNSKTIFEINISEGGSRGLY